MWWSSRLTSYQTVPYLTFSLTQCLKWSHDVTFFAKFVNLLESSWKVIYPDRIATYIYWHWIHTYGEALVVAWAFKRTADGLCFIYLRFISLIFSSQFTELFFYVFQFYKVYWICSGCSYYYYRRSGSQTVDNATSCTFNNLYYRGTYKYTVHAETTLGIGENSTTSITVRRYFGGVRNLRANVNNYTMTVQWDAPSDIQAKDIKVCDSVRNSITYGNHPHKWTW